MPRPRTNRPAYRHYRPKNLAVVRIEGRDHYLGPYGSEASYERYHRLVAEWLGPAPPLLPSLASPPPRPHAPHDQRVDLEVLDVRPRLLPEERRTDQRTILYPNRSRPLRRLFGRTSTSEFGPKSLKVVGEHMVASGLCRTTINKYVHRIKRLFAWGVEQELVDVRIDQALATVRGLAKGRTKAAERPPVRPVTLEQINAALPHLSPILQAMIQFQRLTGCRPTEACLLRPCDIDTSGPVWCYRPSSHKTEHHGMERRRIFIGPAAQQFLHPYLERPADAYCFSPASAAPKSPTTPIAGRRVEGAASRRAIEVDRPAVHSGQLPPRHCSSVREGGHRSLGPESASASPGNPDFESEFGLESSQTVLGHSRADTTQLYAERDFALAENVMSQLG